MTVAMSSTGGSPAAAAAAADLSPTEFVLSSFRPRVAVLASPAADALCLRSNLSLTELLQPMSRLNTAVYYRDPMNTQVSVHGLTVQFDSIGGATTGGAASVPPPPPPPVVAAKLLHSVVRDHCPPLATSDATNEATSGTADEPSGTPWFNLWRLKLLQVIPPGEHEFHHRFIACILVAGGVDNCLQQLQHLQQLQRQLQHGGTTAGGLELAANSWFSSNTLIYFVLVTDVSGTSTDSADAAFEQVGAKFGTHCCHHLRINSLAQPQHSQPDIWLPHLYRLSTHQECSSTGCVDESRTAVTDTTDLANFPSHIIEGATDQSVAGNYYQHPLADSGVVVDGDKLTAAVHVAGDDSAAAAAALARSESAPQLAFGHRGGCQMSASDTSWRHSQPHGGYLSSADLDRVRALVSEFTVKNLLPHVERMMRSFSDVVNNRKGVSRSLLSATKRLFGAGKPSLGGATIGTSSASGGLAAGYSGGGSSGSLNSVVYSQEAPEIQVRKLGDLAFMFGHYDLAYQAYHTAKRDFSSDAAWLHFAGAVEMAALAAFLHAAVDSGAPSSGGGGGWKQFPQHYLDQAIATYMDTCRLPVYALRASLFTAECLKWRGQLIEAAHCYVRMTSEDNDLRSALLLEQAARCFLTRGAAVLPSSGGGGGGKRRFAFHMVLAGHRFSKASLRAHSARVYRRALQIYRGSGWPLIEEHVLLALSRHAVALHRLHTALSTLLQLLLCSASSASDDASGAICRQQHAASQQALFLRELLQAQQKCIALNAAIDNNKNKNNGRDMNSEIGDVNGVIANSTAAWGSSLSLALPVVLSHHTSVLLSSSAHTTSALSSGRTAGDDDDDGAAGGVNDPAFAQQWHSATGTVPTDDIQQERSWYQLEQFCHEQLSMVDSRQVPNSAAMGAPPSLSRPTRQCMSQCTDNKHHQSVHIGESVCVRLTLRNPLQIGLRMTNVRLQCVLADTFVSRELMDETNTGDRQCPSQIDDRLIVPALAECVIQPLSSSQISLCVSATASGCLSIIGLRYGLAGCTTHDCVTDDVTTDDVHCHQWLSVCGPRLNNTLQERCSKVYAKDTRLQLRVDGEGCRVAVHFKQLPEQLLAGQLSSFSVRVKNTSQQLPVRRLLLAFSPSRLLTAATGPSSSSGHQLLELPLPGQQLAAGDSCSWSLYIHAPCDSAAVVVNGRVPVQLLIMASSLAGDRPVLIRHSHQLSVVPVLAVCARAYRVAPCDIERVLNEQTHSAPCSASLRSLALSAASLDVRLTCETPLATAAAMVGSCSCIWLRQVALVSPHWSLWPGQSVCATPRLTTGNSWRVGFFIGKLLTPGDDCCTATVNQKLSHQPERHDDSTKRICRSHLDLESGTERQPYGDTQSCLELASAEFAEMHRISCRQPFSAAAADDVGSQSHQPTSASAASSADKLSSQLMASAVDLTAVLILHWQAELESGDIVCGQHHLTLTSMTTTSANHSLPVATPTVRQPITFTGAADVSVPLRPDWWPGDDVIDRLVSVRFSHAASVAHDFRSQPLCVVPVCVEIVNECRCDLIVQLTATSYSKVCVDVDSSASGSTWRMCDQLVWLGCTRVRRSLPLTSSAGAGVVRVSLALAVSSAGVYNAAAGVELVCRRAAGDDTELTSQRIDDQSLLEVVDLACHALTSDKQQI